MNAVLRRILVCAMLVCAAALSLHAQTVAVSSGQLDIAFTHYDKVLKAEGLDVVYQNYHQGVRQGWDFKSGSVDLTTGYGEVNAKGSFDVVGNGVLLQMENPTVVTDADGARVTAKVLVNGIDQGRQTVFQILNGPVYTLPLASGSFTDAKLRFTFDPQFWISFEQMFDLAPAPAPAECGDLAVRVTLQ